MSLVPVPASIPVAPPVADPVPDMYMDPATCPVRVGFQYVIYLLAGPYQPIHGGALVLVDDDDDVEDDDDDDDDGLGEDLDLNVPGDEPVFGGYVGYATASDFGAGGPLVFIDGVGMDLLLKAEGGALVDLIVETLEGLQNDRDDSLVLATWRLLWDAADRMLSIDGRGASASRAMAAGA